jgi:hypothetical protein
LSDDEGSVLLALRDALSPSQWSELVEILRREDAYLLQLAESGAPFSAGQVAILHDFVLGEVMSTFDREDDWAPTRSTDRLEALLGAVQRALPEQFPPQPWEGEKFPFDRYEEFGESRPPEHPPRPLRPGGWSPPPPPLPLDIDHPPEKLSGWSVSALNKMDTLGIEPNQLRETFYRPDRRCILDVKNQLWLISDDHFELELDVERIVVDFSIVVR